MSHDEERPAGMKNREMSCPIHKNVTSLHMTVGLAKSGQEKIEIEITPNISFDWPKELCRRTVDVGTDEERVREAGAVPEPQ